MFSVNKNPSAKDLRKFGWAMLIGFGVIGAVLWLWGWAQTPEPSADPADRRTGQVIAVCLGALGVLLGVVSLGFPAAARPVYVAWMSIVAPIGIVMSTLLLTVLFVFLLPVFSLIVRFGDPLRTSLRRTGTYWEDYKRHEPTLDRTARPF